MYFQRRTAEQQRTFLFGIAFRNRHHEHKAVQVFQRQHSLQLDVQGGTAWERALFLKSRPGKAARDARTGLNRLDRVLYDRAFCPRVCPIPKHAVRANGIFDTCNEALLRLPLVACEQKGEQVELVHLLREDVPEILYRRILAWVIFRTPASE